jgi:hypothetical protein
MDNTRHFRNILYVNLLKCLAFFSKPPTPSARATFQDQRPASAQTLKVKTHQGF